MNNNARKVISLAAGLLTLVGAFVIGPRPIAIDGRGTGDNAIAEYLFEASQGGHKQLAATVVSLGDDRPEVRFGGRGATENTEVEIGSVTKSFTAELLRQEVEAGTVSYETKVGELIDVGDSAIADVTLKELASHTSGLERLVGLNNFTAGWANLTNGNPYGDVAPQEILDNAAEATIEDRGDRAYSNYGYALLGQLLASKTGTSYEELLKTRIFEPAGMDSTYVALPGAAEGKPTGYSLNGHRAKAWEMNGYAPTGAIRSTPADMARFALFVLGRTGEGSLDYGWDDFRGKGTDFPYKNGATGGFRSGMAIDPETRTAVFVSSNTAKSVDDMTWELLRRANDQEV